MQINISGHHVEITEALRNHVEEKFSRLSRHMSRASHAKVILSVEKSIQKAEATILVSGGSIFADAAGENMYASIDALTGKLDRQLIKYKEKQSNHRGPQPEIDESE